MRVNVDLSGAEVTLAVRLGVYPVLACITLE